MSGPVSSSDVDVESALAPPTAPTLEISDSRESMVGHLRVRRALPRRERRTVGAWCFLDHAGPVTYAGRATIGIGPHPHIGLQTVTWPIEGELLHHDSLGSEQLIRPGQLNLMTAGHGVAHAEEGTHDEGTLHIVQLWVAHPAATREGAPAFEHHAELPQLELGEATATVLIGELAGQASPARRDTDHIGVELNLRGAATVPLRAEHEYALVVVDGAVGVDQQIVQPGRLAYLGQGRDELHLSTATSAARALLIGGAPFGEQVLMWWNYVARTREEISAAHRDWTQRNDRFGSVRSVLSRIDVPPPPWQTA